MCASGGKESSTVGQDQPARKEEQVEEEAVEYKEVSDENGGQCCYACVKSASFVVESWERRVCPFIV